MATAQALRYVRGSKNAAGVLHLLCRVKPGASKVREGITAITNDAIEICVAAQARDGDANRAALTLLSEVLQVPKSDLEIVRGGKAREKTVAVGGALAEAGEEACLDRVAALLNRATTSRD